MTTDKAHLTINLTCAHPIAQASISFNGTASGFNTAVHALPAPIASLNAKDLWMFFKAGLMHGKFNSMFADGTYNITIN